MMQSSTGKDCALRMWVIAAVAGLIVAVIVLLGGRSFMAALFTGVIVGGLSGVILTWLFCKPEDRAHAPSAHTEAPVDPAAFEPAPPDPTPPDPTPSDDTPSDAPPAEPAPAAHPTPDPGTDRVGASDIVTPSTPLAGEAELAARKGSWSYDTAPNPGAGNRPAALAAARDGGADDLKKIKGVGPKLETLLNQLGFYHFDQIAGWSAAEIAWVDENLQGFKGRVSRDNWVSQAAALAAGDNTG